MVKSHRL